MLRAPGVTLIVARRWSTTTRAESRVPPTSVATTQVAPIATDVTVPVRFTRATVVSRLTQV